MKKIKPNEEFQLDNDIFVYSVVDGRIKIERVGKGKPAKQSKSFSPPTTDEVVDYFVKNGYSENAARRFYNWYSVADWKDSNGNQVKNWKQKAHGIWFKDENKAEILKQKMVR